MAPEPNWRIQVRDMTGRLLIHVPYTPLVDASGLPNGMYTLHIIDPEKGPLALRQFVVAR
jgi:hypothetical protein